MKFISILLLSIIASLFLWPENAYGLPKSGGKKTKPSVKNPHVNGKPPGSSITGIPKDLKERQNYKEHGFSNVY